jgi:predicted RNase H-like nuclease (RuvC/YqgF family)
MWTIKKIIKEQQFLVGISMKQHQMRRGVLAIAVAFLAIISTSVVSAQSLEEVLGVRANTTQDGRKSQIKIDELTDQTRDLLSQFKQVMKVVDGLKVYNQQQERLIRNQESEMAELNDSIDNVTVIERQIGPLIERMIDNLDKFVSLDIPFLLKERQDRIAFLKDTLDRSDVAVSEKFSQVLQAYQVENSYGSTIEAYTDVIELEGKDRQVDLLKWGRVSLVFQTPDAATTGVWDNKAREWVIVGDEFRSGVRDGIRIARKTQTAGLVQLPVAAPGE